MRAVVHSTILVGFGMLVVVPRAVWPKYYANDVRQAAGRAMTTRARDIQADWKKTPFTGVSNVGLEEAFLGKIQWSSLGLSDVQTTSLTNRLVELIRYFEQPDFETYYRLKTDGFQYRFVPAMWVTNFLREAALVSTQFDGDPKELIRILWGKVHNNNGNAVLPKVTAICLESVAGTVSHTNSARVMLGGPIKQGFTVATEALEPGFQYALHRNAGLSPLLFEFSFLVKVNESGMAGPLHISLVWVDADKTWALNRLILDTSLGFQTMF
jgi:hypothetical protein